MLINSASLRCEFAERIEAYFSASRQRYWVAVKGQFGTAQQNCQTCPRGDDLRDSPRGLGRECVTECRACRVLDQPRSTQRRWRHVPSDEPRILRRIVELGAEYGRYGYRRVTALLHREGWQVNHKRVERIWRQEGLKVPQMQPKRRRLWLNDGACVRLRSTHRNHV